MLRSVPHRTSHNEAGQALPLFGLLFMILIGFTALSIDVGRYVWARTSMQAGVDAAALAAAQSMPSQTDAETKATEYWIDNSGFIQSQGTNVNFAVTYPPGNKRIRVSGEADIPTWFAKFFGVDHWHVTAEGDAEAQVLDISVVLDISGSMCFDSYPMVEQNTNWMGPSNTAYQLTVDNVGGISAGTTVIKVSPNVNNLMSTSGTTNTNVFGWGGSTRYRDRDFGSSRTGSIMIDNEIMDIVSINTATNEITVSRGQNNNNTDTPTTAASHAEDAVIKVNHNTCAKAAPSPTVGPFEPYNGMQDAATYFTTLFNPSYDKIGLAQFSTEAGLNQNLTYSLSGVATAIDNMSLPNGGTNIAHGLAVGRQVLDGTGKRANAVRVLVILTDGVANYYCGLSTYDQASYNSTSCSENNSVPTGVSHAYSEAVRATNADIIIFTIGLGDGVDANFLKRIADGGTAGVGPCQQSEPGCRYYFAPTTAQLDEAFEAIAEQTHIALVR